MPTVGFEPTISAGERPQTYPLDRAATGTGMYYVQTYALDRAATGTGMYYVQTYALDRAATGTGMYYVYNR